MNWTIGTIIALISLIIVIVCHLCTTVWWMAKLATTLARLSDDVKDAMKDIKALVPKEDCVRSHSNIQKQFDAIWKKIDNSNMCPNHKGQP